MLKLARNTSNAEELDKLKGRVVDSIEEFHLDLFPVGKCKAWRGSTLEEFFSIMFTNGMLTLCINEREMLLHNDTIGVAMAPILREAVDISKEDEEKGLLLTKTYTNGGQMDEDIKNLEFNDVLEVLGWTMKDGTKFKIDNFLS